VQAALSVLARRAVRAGDPPLDLSGSLLPEARLDGARLAQADLRGADVRGTSLRDADLAGARVNGATRWPSGFDWRAAGARPVPVCLA
jgi:Pentapeptide repeats (8 copies)